MSAKLSQKRSRCVSYLVPVVLIRHELQKFLPCLRGHREFDVTLELENTIRRPIERFAVELDIPNPRRAVLRISSTARVNEELLARRMRPDERSEAVRLDGLVAEELDVKRSAASDRREQAVRAGLGAILAADECAAAGPEGTDDYRDLGHELYEVGHRDAVGLVNWEQFLGVCNDVLQAVVFRTQDFFRCED